MPTEQMSLFDLPGFLDERSEKKSSKVEDKRQNLRPRQDSIRELGIWISRLEFWLSRPKDHESSKNWKLFEEETADFVKNYYQWVTAGDFETKERLFRQLVGRSYLLVVRMLGIYRLANSLGNNLNPNTPENRHKVVHVEDGWFRGRYSNVKDYEGFTSSKLDSVLDIQKCVCTLAGVEAVSRNWLCDHLVDVRDYASYRGMIKTRIAKPDKYHLFSLKDISPRRKK